MSTRLFSSSNPSPLLFLYALDLTSRVLILFPSPQKKKEEDEQRRLPRKEEDSATIFRPDVLFGGGAPQKAKRFLPLSILEGALLEVLDKHWRERRKIFRVVFFVWGIKLIGRTGIAPKIK